MDPPNLRCRHHHRQQEPDGFHPRHRHEDFLDVNAFPLDKAPSDKLHLVLGNGAAIVVLHLEDPLEPNWPAPERRIY